MAGASLVAAEAVWSGRAEHAFNPAGGLHHALPEQASGFCVYNDLAIVVAWLLEQGAQRVAYVDVDVHHGDGPQAIFYDDPRVLTISVHQSGATLFPGTGFVDELGEGAGVGYSVNLPLQPFTDDAVFDDVEPWERKLAVYRHAVWQDSGQWAFTANEPSYVPVDQGMPLTRELEHFIHCIETRSPPLTSGVAGLVPGNGLPG